MFFMRFTITILFFFLIIISSLAQVKSVSGTVIDQDSKLAMPGVTVVALSKGTEKLLGGSASNEKGEFDIKGKFTEKEFFIRLTYVGYETFTIDSFIVKDNKINLGTISMHASALMTSTVEVQGQKSMVEFYVDKQVINMEKVPGSTSGSVTDALRNTGIVEVEPTTNKLSVRGNSNVNILIDGKPQPMADNLLSQMPATYVDKVEVITTPSAKDDPEGDGGTINIITKKEHRDNFNGSLFLYSSTQGFGFGSFTFNYRKNNLNIFSSANTYMGKFSRNTQSRRTNYQSSTLHSQTSAGDFVMKGYMGGLKLGLDYDFDTLNSFSITGNYNKTNGKMITNSFNENFNIDSVRTYGFGVNDDGQGDFNNTTISTNYKKKFNMEGHEITADAFYSDMTNSMKSLLKTDYDYMALFPALQRNINDVKNKTFILNSDYVNPTAEIGKFEAGYKFTFRNRSAALESSNYLYSTASYEDTMGLSNIFKYKEFINAAYVTYTNKILILEYKLGLRTENTVTDGKQLVTGDNFSTNYFTLFPTLGLAYKINDLFQVALNASRKINRPQMEMINPFVRVNNPNEITRGNPRLSPTFTNSFELRFNPLLNLYYNFSNGRPSQMTIVDDSLTINTTINSAKNKNFGFELTIPVINEPRFPIKLPEWFSMFNLRIAYSRFIEEGSYMSEVYSVKRNTWWFNGNLSLKLWGDINATAYFFHNPANGDVRYHWGSTTFVGMMLSKDFFDRKLTLSLNVNDIFKSSNSVAETWGSNFYSYNKSEFVKSRNIGLSIRYNFNDFTNRREKDIDDGRDREGGITPGNF